MRPIWSGTISFGLVTIPVKVYSTVETQSEVNFRLLDSETLTPIKEVRVNPESGEEVPWERVTRGVEYAKGKFLALTAEELKALPLPSARTVELLGFVDAEEIDPLFFDKAYFLAPGPGGEKAYDLLRRALEEKGKAGIGKVALRTREHLVALLPKENALIMHTLHYADEVRAVDDVPDLPGQVRIAAPERRMAEELVAGMSIEFEPSAYKSEYKKALTSLVKAKLAGREVKVPAGPAKVIDLQDALRRSLEQARKGQKPARREAARRRAAG